ncbi:MAG: tetratricopeptide repeat protein [Deltaproteobacteria bacterium]|nr:tetratricopeptide repeat protein [Deltaproteobacteria bacterium]
MNAQTQQAIVAQWQQWLQTTTQQVTQILQEAHAGCQGLIAQHPTDPTPLSNALSAVGLRISALQRSISDTLDSHVVGQLALTPQPDQAEEHARRQGEIADGWIEESWQRFEAQWRYEAIKAMWPHVQQALQRPTPCSRCSAPLQRTTPHKPESITCAHCRSINQVAPEGVVATYFGGAPDAHAQVQTLEASFAVRRNRQAAETARREHHLRTGDWIDEPIASLKQWEKLQLDLWAAYVKARAQIAPSTPEADRDFIASRMKAFYDEMARNDVWRAAHGMPSLHAARQQAAAAGPDWGPLKPDQIEEYFYHDFVIEEARPDAQRLAQTLARFGYRDATHFEQVKRTFLDYHTDHCGEDWFQALVNKAVIRAQQDRMQSAVQSQAHLMAPVEGVDFETYARLAAHQGSASPDEFLQILAQNGMDRAKYDRVSTAYMDRMSKDTTGAMATVFSKAWANAGAGKYAAAAKAGMDAMGAGGIATSAPAAAEPISLEKYAEVSGAMAAWSKQGKDISAMLHTTFQMTAQDMSQIGLYWHAMMTADFSLMEKMSAWTEHFELVYLGQKAVGSPLPQPMANGKFISQSQSRDLTPEENQIYQMLNARDYVRAHGALRALLAREPTNPVALALQSFALGNLRMTLPPPQAAEVAREQAAHAPIVMANLEQDRIDPRVPIGQIQIAALVEAFAIVAGGKLAAARSPTDLSNAADLAEDGLRINPNHADLLKIRCMALFRAEDYDEAKEVLAQIMTLPPDQGFMAQIAPYMAKAPKDDDDDD